ncbi:hypothetical protein T484DRAFT_1609845 [Baffinella frigidus]|nr:hypothetical protein T484DRAFT_1609845 [Cryptophyta sp. CCMP2293]
MGVTGHAFPGIHALQEGASVDFQDYNAEVLEEVTVPNVIVNGGEAAAQRPPRYFAGDWGSLPAIAGEKKYDLVLTAETIYEEKASHRLLLCIDKLLAPSGVAYVAAKSYYFGVGGSTRGFEESVARLTPHRSVSRATLIQDGSSNVREVLRIS